MPHCLNPADRVFENQLDKQPIEDVGRDGSQVTTHDERSIASRHDSTCSWVARLASASPRPDQVSKVRMGQFEEASTVFSRCSSACSLSTCPAAANG
jgi:hypothetical protein